MSNISPFSTPPLGLVETERIFEAEGIDEAARTPRRSLPVRIVRGILSAIEWLFGLACLMVALAALASMPVLQMLSLGYLLEASGRVARTGKLRSGFIGVRAAARLGAAVVCAWLFLLPVRFVADMWRTAALIDPRSGASASWRAGLVILTAAVLLHILWAWLRGGRIRHFLWPAPWRLAKTFPQIINGQLLSDVSQRAFDFVAEMRLPYYFWLGVRGFAGAVVWLFVPIFLMAVAPHVPNPGLGVLSGLLGGFLFAAVLLYLPFLQARFAAENRFWAIFEWRQVRQQFQRAPIAFWFALLVTLLFALPLYLLKIELTPKEITWFPALFFVVFIYPARLLTGWALGLAERREKPRHFVFRWLTRLAAIPVVAFFAFLVYFTQYFTWEGGWSLFEQHAFLVPTPFLGG